MNEKKVCPIMARGWLSSKWAGKGENTFALENLPKCIGEKCAWWDCNLCKCKGAIK